ncbi:uncharacterized protein MONBRDRAFT_28462 [Monosiga brevicollis MX1]|uniref:B30.2/SPRY domain-containing protein n=1 Tax=Monosiga brevicollis TaxID=81824 RepID=A9V887_MONBE|nr:uncharacterized protein MONBRDRAFT_28462 [Monosiga brevicollis MX1]EDQ86296.1 predicted protein [Monosiga brevicollis MX1]|eukprot:XP_001748966.1 hypothetical protein [Monosiga brevicollis MX1]
MASPLYHKHCPKCGTATDQLGQYCRNCGNCVLCSADDGEALSYRAPSLVKHTDALQGSFCPYSGRLDIEESAQTIKVAKRGGNNWVTAWMTDPMKDSDVVYFEVELLQDVHGCFGFIQKPVGFMAGGDAGYIYTTPGAARPSPKLKAKDKLGFLVDFFSNRIVLYINDKRHGTMCSGIRDIKGGIVFACSLHYDGHSFVINRNPKLPQEVEQLRTTLQAQQDFIERACSRLELKAQEARQLKQAREIDQKSLAAALEERDRLRRRLAEFETKDSTASEPQFAPKASASVPKA